MPISAGLSDTALRNVKPGDPRKRLSDGKGLYLLLFVNGGSHGWRFDYSIRGRRKTLSLGTYPDTSLSLARDKAKRARQQVAEGLDPSDGRKAAKAEAKLERDAESRIASGLPALGSFECVAREWFDVHQSGWAPSYGEKVIRRLERDIFPWIGKKPVDRISVPEVLEVLRRIESRGVLETTHRARENCSQVFRFAIASGLALTDPARDLAPALRRPVSDRMAAIIEPSKLAQLLRAIDGYSGTLIVRTALKLSPMLMVRPGELRHAQWSELDLDGGVWTIPAARMKGTKVFKASKKNDHVVPLARQAVQLLRELLPLTGPGGYVFRGVRDHERPMSENTVNAALQRMGYDTQEEMTGHGFRATARTIVSEQLKFPSPVIEAQLAHAPSGPLGSAYDRAKFLEARHDMMQQWADYLDQLRHGGEVIELRRAA